jgi:Ni,Fe-hydrogenase III large subunit/Ni,Fe-hydrogenase III component G
MDILSRGEKVEAHKPWPRYRLERQTWEELLYEAQTAKWDLLGLWADTQEVHLALYDGDTRVTAIASFVCSNSKFPSVTEIWPSAIRLERTVQDFYGYVSENLADTRPWLDHGQFPMKHPLLARPLPAEPRPATEYEFLSAGGEPLHQIPVGPVHAGIIEPGHFRFHANGEAVVRLEERLGYVHKGIEKLMEGRTVEDAARVVARTSGDATVAYGIAYARAVEAALDVKVTGRAHALRALMAEMERIANHFGDVGAVCNDAAFAYMHSQCGVLRERVLAAAMACFGHRLMMDRVVPGGVTHDIGADQVKLLREMVRTLRQDFAPLVELYDNKPSLLDRTVSTGTVSSLLVERFAAGGHVGRASSRSFDARKSVPYEPYEDLDFEVPVFSEGDVHARVWVRIREIGASLKLIEQLLASLPADKLLVPVPVKAGEGVALVESFRGDVLVWVKIGADGRIVRCHPRDPSWFQWPLLEASIEGNIVADFPLCNKSFNCSYSGQDL